MSSNPGEGNRRTAWVNHINWFNMGKIRTIDEILCEKAEQIYGNTNKVCRKKVHLIKSRLWVSLQKYDSVNSFDLTFTFWYRLQKNKIIISKMH